MLRDQWFCGRISKYRRLNSYGLWRLPGRWPDGGRGSIVAKWTRRRAAPAYDPISDLKLQYLASDLLPYNSPMWSPVCVSVYYPLKNSAVRNSKVDSYADCVKQYRQYIDPEHSLADLLVTIIQVGLSQTANLANSVGLNLRIFLK